MAQQPPKGQAQVNNGAGRPLRAAGLGSGVRAGPAPGQARSCWGLLPSGRRGRLQS